MLKHQILKCLANRSTGSLQLLILRVNRLVFAVVVAKLTVDSLSGNSIRLPTNHWNFNFAILFAGECIFVPCSSFWFLLWMCSYVTLFQQYCIGHVNKFMKTLFYCSHSASSWNTLKHVQHTTSTASSCTVAADPFITYHLQYTFYLECFNIFLLKSKGFSSLGKFNHFLHHLT